MARDIVPRMTETPPKRAWFQLHLSTAIVLMLAAGALSYLNVRTVPYSYMSWRGLYIDAHGWPYPWYGAWNVVEEPADPKYYTPREELVGFRTGWAFLDLVVAFGILFYLAVALESMRSTWFQRSLRLRITLGVVAWLMLFGALTLCNHYEGDTAYSDDWGMGFGYPHWLGIFGDWHFPGFWKGLREGEWQIEIDVLFGSLCIPGLLVLLPLALSTAIRSRFRFHLQTALVVTFTASALLGLNFLPTSAGPEPNDMFGWPIPMFGDYSYWWGFLPANLACWLVILIAVAFGCEAWLRRRARTKA